MFGAQIVHINEGEGKLTLFFNLFFSLYYPPPHRPCNDSTLNVHFNTSLWIVKPYHHHHHHHHHISIVFPPPPHFYRFPPLPPPPPPRLLLIFIFFSFFYQRGYLDGPRVLVFTFSPFLALLASLTFYITCFVEIQYCKNEEDEDEEGRQ